MSDTFTITATKVTVTARLNTEVMHKGYATQPIKVSDVEATFEWRDGGWKLRGWLTVYGARVKKNGELYDEYLDRSVTTSWKTGEFAGEDVWATDVVDTMRPTFIPAELNR
ncbi:hypothetical protein ACFVU2_21240 [Leifsonia sp. NPDC058194]|uniref:hypothetical protein n=1 Tax=Leifsonia sp. NPDC058194 TaxID=3346374 RepID=UPI0036D8EBBF